MRVEIESPKDNIERNPLLLLICVVLSVALCSGAWILLKNMNGWGFLVAVVAIIISFQTLWMLLNPFALVFDNRVEFKQSWFHEKERFFVDVEKIGETKKGEMFLSYHDGEAEKLNLLGIRRSDRTKLKAVFRQGILANKPA